MTVLVVRFLLTRNWLRHLRPSDGRENPSLTGVPPRLLQSHACKILMADTWFSTTISSDLKPGPSAQHTACWYTTVGYCHSVSLFQLCSASTVNDPATSNSLPRSDVLPRCVWRATSGSASDGYRASSIAVTWAAENMTAQ